MRGTSERPGAPFPSRPILRTLPGVLCALGVGAFLAMVIAVWRAPVVDIALEADAGRAQQGFAVLVPLPAPAGWLYTIEHDDVGSEASSIRIFEDGRQLGPAHSSHESIRRQGRGAYSHWQGYVYLSASDNTDPRFNGRAYRAAVPLSLQPRWVLAGWGGGLAGLAAGYLLVRRRRRTQALEHAVLAFIRFIGRPVQSEPPVVAALALTLGTIASAGLVAVGWLWGDTTTSAAEISRFLPVSDALGYHSCATSIAAFGDMGGGDGADWCSRRVLYTTMLASLMMATGSDSLLVLLLQGAVAGLAAAALSLRVARFVGPAGGLLVAAVLFVFIWECVAGLFMTEVAGFALSLVGAVLLLQFAEYRRPWQLLAGTVFFGVAMTSRAGALFALPAIALWAWIFATDRPGVRAWPLLGIATVGLALGVVMQFVLVLALGQDPLHSGSNFAATLYGLSTGSRDWTDAYRDFAPLFAQGEQAAFEHIYGVAIRNIVSDPRPFLAALHAAAVDFAPSLFHLGLLKWSSAALTGLAVVGLLRLMVARSAFGWLLLLLTLGELASAPFLVDSGGVRIFAATFFVRATLCAVGLQWLLQLLVQTRESPRWSARAGQAALSVHASLLLGSALVVAMVASATPLSRISREPLLEGIGCPDNTVEVIARLGGGSQMITFTPRSGMIETVNPFRVGRERFANDRVNLNRSFGSEVLNIDRPLTLIRAVDVASDPHGSRIKPLVYRGELEPSSRPKSLCVDPRQTFDFVSVAHQLVVSVRELPARQGFRPP